MTGNKNIILTEEIKQKVADRSQMLNQFYGPRRWREWQQQQAEFNTIAQHYPAATRQIKYAILVYNDYYAILRTAPAFAKKRFAVLEQLDQLLEQDSKGRDAIFLQELLEAMDNATDEQALDQVLARIEAKRAERLAATTALKQQLDPRGFSFKTSEARDAAFMKAEAYFAKNPSEVKLSRKNWQHLFAEEQNPSLNSFITIPPENLTFAIAIGKDLGGLLGAGAFGRVKYAMDKTGNIYVIKIEEKNFDKSAFPGCTTAEDVLRQLQESSEAKIAKDVGLMTGNTRFRVEEVNGQWVVKSYKVLEYLGKSLSQRLQDGEYPRTLPEKQKVARKIAWQTHRLHTGQASATGKPYVHRDLKPHNIILDNDGQVHLADFGLARDLAAQHLKLDGTKGYLPVYPDGSICAFSGQLNSAQRDTFAVKKTLYWTPEYQPHVGTCLFNETQFQQLPTDEQDLIRINSYELPGAIFDITGKKNDDGTVVITPEQTPLLVAIHFLNPEIQTYHPNTDLLTLNEKQQATFCECWEQLDIAEIQFKGNELIQETIRKYRQQVAVNPAQAAKISKTITALMQSSDPETFAYQEFNDLLQQLETAQISLDDIQNYRNALQSRSVTDITLELYCTYPQILLADDKTNESRLDLLKMLSPLYKHPPLQSYVNDTLATIISAKADELPIVKASIDIPVNILQQLTTLSAITIDPEFEHPDLYQPYSQTMQKKFLAAPPSEWPKIQREIDASLHYQISTQWQAVIKEITRLENKYCARSSTKELCQHKASLLRAALKEVPLNERATVFTQDSPACQKVQHLLAQHRISKEALNNAQNDTVAIDRKQAAKSYKNIYKQFINNATKNTPLIPMTDAKPKQPEEQPSFWQRLFGH